jgi:glutamate formiminotransferase
MVLTLIGEPTDTLRAVLAAAAVAVELIDLNAHDGVHPRLGALDVLPFVPLANITMDECAVLARTAADELWRLHRVPIYLYECASPVARTLPAIRKGAFTEFRPDIGGPEPHPTAGSSVVGARGPLVAFNANLETDDLQIAKRIAGLVRSQYSGRVRALGLALPSRGATQVSMNVIDPAQTDIVSVIAYIEAHAHITDCELIGALPGYNAFESVRSALRVANLKPGQIITETWPSGDFDA